MQVPSKNSGKAAASWTLGTIGLVVWIWPGVAITVTVIGLVLGILGLKSARRELAIVGIILCSTGLVLASLLGALLLATGTVAFPFPRMRIFGR